ncbi:MAG: SH3-like domain-containing protein [Lactobacillus equicursoris]|uniref:SH3-like domain-containing protein n=1 Tax=Lactobacillus equicursoris TaxID=420645 RepID=UPI0024313CAC|nr:SH3-like domain-containing protein [Lactobacillus equicursoris]MDD6407363.1 SH3-like domain-containing protein [Lactobacillus equicursoris]
MEKGKKSLLLLAAAGAALAVSQPAQAQAAVTTKMPNGKTMNIYSKVSAKGPSKKVSSTKYFKTSKIQVSASKKTKKGYYDYMYANGRPVGWVKESWFLKNKISAAGNVYLVKGDNSFDKRDALNYAVDSRGNVINPNSVQASVSGDKLTYSYGKIKKTVNLYHVDNPNSGIHPEVSTQKGPKEVASTRSHSGSSAKWNARNNYGVETSSNSWTSGGLTLKTNLWEPRNLSLEGNGFQQVGPVMEGMAVNGGWAYSSWYASAGATDVANPKGNIVAFNLSKINKYKAQYLSPRNYLYNQLSFKNFERYSQNLKVSPYIKLGHGQSLGASGKYIYVLANRNKLPGGQSNGFYSEEILQLKKSNLQLNKIWSIKVDVGTSARYFHNAAFAGDGTMYGLFHNGGSQNYEYWKLNLVGNTWKVTKVTGTSGNFVKQNSSASPVQGLAYGNGHFYVAFNNLLFKVKENGKYEKTWKHTTNREIEGLSVSGSKLYVQLAQRGEILSGKW